MIFSWTATATVKAQVTRETNRLPRLERLLVAALADAEKFRMAEDWRKVGRLESRIEISKRRIAEAQEELARRG